MDRFVIEGGTPLNGTIKVSGAKNSALPILIATLLTDEPCVVENVPSTLRDLRTTFRLLESLGKTVKIDGSTVHVSSTGSLKTQAPYDIVKQMRASVLAAGPLLARFGLVRVPIPGGCAIGLRPIDIHLKGFEAMGARRIADQGDIIMSAPRLAAVALRLRFPSVGATQNLMMAAAATPGRTVIKNAAKEPEIGDLGRFLERLGARVTGAGTATVAVEGRTKLKGCRHRVIADRIEAGTYLLACAAARGKVKLLGAEAGHLDAVIAALRKSGAKVRCGRGFIELSMERRSKPVSVVTRPYPGFPTDLQAPWMALMTLSTGFAKVTETVFENRYLHAAELGRMGAQIAVSGRSAVVAGVERLSGAPIMASDIRAGAALLVAALAAKGRTIIQRVYHIDRGYESLVDKFSAVGARIERQQ
ncbi:MAG TPA: UDP-N-acetylglucosamine 1-carboxyvinyltransferase [Elusimicrobia bacterium]|nr:MAG: UDP-N-acetylglucosamine 1-carboxyvinyltransferase [Elusimicrobia bacterium GWA2_66_18]OGR72736.1 MAG: UDP-N-acetylglucosamine 1-carboxyvinyltransferase [Elusimicrobia bacterium GWC2_65_9]HAZ08719.1 UDP-N-acetylglucosamine 1-carboxyvinyltransferase [Elusimicrobiota bacterium]